jgi:hypothetical protein
MSAKILSVLCGAMALLAGCGAAVDGALTQDELTTTGFVRAPNISNSGVIDIGLENDVTTRVAQTSPGSGSGYAFQTGAIPNEGLFAVAGLLPNTTVTAVPTSGFASYSGSYNLVQVSNINISGGEIQGTPELLTEPLTLIANFANDKLVDDGGSDLQVNGTVNGTDIGGTVTFNGVQGNLDGLIGGNRAIGAFHGEGNVGPGTDDDYMYAGGFIANRI